MKILVLGGTGAMGKHLCEILSKNGNELLVTTRSRKSNDGKIKYVEGNAHDLSFLANILNEKWDCIVDFMVYNTNEFSSRVKLLLNATEQYVFLSSARVYADSRDPITEDSPRLVDICADEVYLQTDEYALSKGRQENILFNAEKKNWTIIRPYITYSEQRLQLGVFEKEEWLSLAMNSLALVFSSDIAKHTTTLTYGYDVALGIASIIGKERAIGQAFHITGDNCSIKWSDVNKLYAQVLEENKYPVKIYEEDYCYRINNNTSKYQVIYDRCYDRIFDNSKISEFIDVTKFKKPEEGLRSCLEDYLNNNKQVNIVIGEGIAKAIHKYNLKIPLSRVKSKKQKIKYILIKLHII